MSGGNFVIAGGFWHGGTIVATSAPDPLEQQTPTKPLVFRVHKARPNPFNPSTTIHYEIPTSSRVRMEIYNVMGQLVDVLVDEDLAAGRHAVTWRGRDSEGSSVASGVYLVRTTANQWTDQQKITLLK